MYKLGASDVGKPITVTVTGKKTGFTTVSKTSKATPKVATVAFAAAPTPTISGSVSVGSTLIVQTGAWNPAAVLSYQWYRAASGSTAYTAVSGATTATYALAIADEGYTFQVDVTGRLTGYTVLTRQSAATAAVAPGTIVNIGPPSISGASSVGSVLTASPGTWAPAGTAIAYQWDRDGSPVDGATGSTYTVVSADTGHEISVAVTASESGYTSQTASSSPVEVTDHSDDVADMSIVAGVEVAPHAGPSNASSVEATGVAVDGSGNLFIADANNLVDKVTPEGVLSILAGNGLYGEPTPGPATSSDLTAPTAVAVDGSGNLFIADPYDNLVEKVTPDGMLSIVAGTGQPGAPTPGPATSSALIAPQGVAVDGSGDLYIADDGNSVVEKVTPQGTLSIVAGNGRSGAPTPGPATSSALFAPQGVAVDGSGDLYIADQQGYLVEKVTPDGVLSIVAGNGRVGTPTPGPATLSALGLPVAVAVDSSGNLFIADAGDNVVEKVTPDGVLSIVAGNGDYGTSISGPATSSALEYPSGVAVDGSGNLFIADQGNEVLEKVTPAGVLSIVAGNGGYGRPTPGPATSSHLSGPDGVAVDASGDLYIADWGNDLVEKVTPAGVLSIIAGDGRQAVPTPGPATSSALDGPSGVAVDGSGDVFISDLFDDVVEKVTPDGVLSIVAGIGRYGAPTPGPATSSALDGPSGVAVDGSGDLFIADGNRVVEKVTPDGVLSIVAGNGRGGEPTPGPATSSALGEPAGVAVDGSGDLFIADVDNDVVEKVTPAGVLSVVAGNGRYGTPTPGLATSSPLDGPVGLAVDASGNLFIPEQGSYEVEKVTPAGVLSVAAGNGQVGVVTPGPATSSSLAPTAAAVDASGDVYVATGSDVVKLTW